jgi:hypothetical protein
LSWQCSLESTNTCQHDDPDQGCTLLLLIWKHGLLLLLLLAAVL